MVRQKDIAFLELLSELNTQHAMEATIGTDSESLSPFIARSKNCDSGQLYFRTFGSLPRLASGHRGTDAK